MSEIIWLIIGEGEGVGCAVTVGPPLYILLSLGRGGFGAKAQRDLGNMDNVLPTEAHCGTLQECLCFSLPYVLRETWWSRYLLCLPRTRDDMCVSALG